MLGLGHTAADGIMDDLEKHLVRREEPGEPVGPRRTTGSRL